MFSSAFRNVEPGKAPDVHGFSNTMLRKIASVLAEPLTYLCLSSGECPLARKKSNH